MNNGDNQPAEGSIWNHWSIIIVPLLWALGGLMMTTVVMTLVKVSNDGLTYLESFKLAWQGGSFTLSAFASLLSCILGFIREFNKKSITLHKDFVKRSITLHKDIVNAIAEKPIVLHPPIRPFHPGNLEVFEELLNAVGGPQEALIALDATDPLEWWSNDMLGYLALQAQWVMKKNCRTIKRVFVWDTPAIRSAAGSKLLWLHASFGFKTIICPKRIYSSRAVLSGFHGGKDLKREFLIWDNEMEAIPAKVGKHNTLVYGLDSHWTTDTARENRNVPDGESVFRQIRSKPDATYRVQINKIEELAVGASRKILVLSGHTSHEIKTQLTKFALKL